MGHRSWLAPTAFAVGAAPVLLVARAAHGDHGGAGRTAPLDPITVGILAGLLVLAACLMVGIVARRLLRRSRSAE
jgi:hypothetical protein